MNGRTVGTFRIARYITGVQFSGVSVKRGSTVVNATRVDEPGTHQIEYVVSQKN